MSADPSSAANYSSFGGGGDTPATLRDRAYQLILDGIISLRFTPGTVLSEKSLATEFGMSRTPIRVALEMVSADGLLNLVPHYGFMVDHTTARTVSEVFEIREAIEGYAIRNASFDESRHRFMRYRSYFEYYASEGVTVNTGERSMLRDADVFFHSDIVAALDNSVAAALLTRQLTLRGAYLRNLTSGKELREQLGAGGHAAISEAILADDRDRAVELLTDHLREGREFFIMRLAAGRSLSTPLRFPQLRQALAQWLEHGDGTEDTSLMSLVQTARAAEPVTD